MSRIQVGRCWGSLLAVVACVALAVPAHAEVNAATAVPPVCSTSENFAAWSAETTAAKNALVGAEKYAVGPWTAVGTAHNCASQMHELDTRVCNGSACSMQPIGFETHATATAFPDTIDSAGGDGQNLRVSIPSAIKGVGPGWDGTPILQAAAVTWGQCMPASTPYPGLCNAAQFQETPLSDPTGFPVSGGALLYRFRDTTGVFSGPWTISVGRTTPGFVIKRTGSPCTALMNACDYEVTFTRTTAGKPVNTADAQVLMLLNATVQNPAWTGAPDTFYQHQIAVPMLIVQSGGTAPPNSTPGTIDPGSGTTTPPAQSGGTSNPAPSSNGQGPVSWPAAKKTFKAAKKGAGVPATFACSGKSCTVTLKAPKGAKRAKVTLARGAKTLSTKAARFARTKKATSRTLTLTPPAATKGSYTLTLDVVLANGKSVRMTLALTV